MFRKEVKKVRKGVQGEEMKVKDRDGNMLVEEKTVRHRRAENFDELLNTYDGVQSIVVPVSGDRSKDARIRQAKR